MRKTGTGRWIKRMPVNTIQVFLIVVLIFSNCTFSPAQKTYCNPLNLDYGYCPIPNFTTFGKHRATADPVIVLFKGDYYLFSTNKWGYWWSSDLSKGNKLLF